jgi:very-short-patch-repair endonuclease
MFDVFNIFYIYMIVEYNKKLKKRSQDLRTQSTLSEVLLWNEIKTKKLGYQFMRQKPIGNYIVDFYCKNLKLVIEIDGSSHDTKQEYDKFRTEYLKRIGLHVHIFLDNEVKHNLDAVLKSIKQTILKLQNPPF